MPKHGEPANVSEEEFREQCDELGGEYIDGGPYAMICNTDLGGMTYNPERGVYTIRGEAHINAYPENVRVHNTPFGNGGVDVEGIDHADIDLTYLGTNPEME